MGSHDARRLNPDPEAACRHVRPDRRHRCGRGPADDRDGAAAERADRTRRCLSGRRSVPAFDVSRAVRSGCSGHAAVRDSVKLAPHGECRAVAPGSTSSGSGSTAAARYGWTKVVAREDFSGSSLPASLGAYDGPATGDGVWSPDQIRVGGGVARLTGRPDGKTAGMYWKGSRKYGRWEIRARFPAGCGCYTPLLILWPHDNDWPAGGEIDYAEVFNGDRREVHFNLHYGSADNVMHTVKRVDMTRWRNFAVEWTPDHISWFSRRQAVLPHDTTQRPAARGDVPDRATGARRN